MITLKDLAKELNVSVSTISKALKGSSEISKETITKVKELAKRHNYVPNKTALNLKSQKTKTLGVILPDILNHFFAKALYGIEKQAAKQGYQIITCISNENYQKEKDSIALLSNGSVDGFILSVAEETQLLNKVDHFTKAINDKLPIVMFDRVANTVICDKIIVDDFNATNQATKYLLNENRKNIALISNIKNLSVGKLRTEGYKDAILTSKNYDANPLILNIQNSENIEEEVEQFLKANPAIDGIVSIDNTSGVVALNKMHALQKKVPEEVSIIGFSDENVLQLTTKKLSTIAQHPIDIGSSAVALLIAKLEKKQYHKVVTKTINTELILRQTTL